MMPRRIIPLLCLAIATTAAAHAQAPSGNRVQVSRAELQRTLAEREAASPAPSLREENRRQAEAIRARLRDGDFRVGDRVVVVVEGMPALSDTATVAAGLVLPLPTLGSMPVGGLLRSELEPRLRAHIAQYVRSPVVQVQPLVRVAVEGAVGRPGYYEVPAEARVSDVLMEGALLPTANMRRVHIRRLGSEVWSSALVERALAAGWTLDQLNVHPGDRIVVPQRSQEGTMGTLRWVLGGVIAVVGLGMQL